MREHTLPSLDFDAAEGPVLRGSEVIVSVTTSVDEGGGAWAGGPGATFSRHGGASWWGGATDVAGAVLRPFTFWRSSWFIDGR